MTVIATDGKTMSGDGFSVSGWSIASSETIKVIRLRDGSLIGGSGNASDRVIFERWMNDREDASKLSNDCAFLHLKLNGEIDYYTNALAPMSLPVPQAVGCGSDFAMAAMRCGKSPEEAVELACSLSIGCGGLITTLKLIKEVV